MGCGGSKKEEKRHDVFEVDREERETTTATSEDRVHEALDKLNQDEEKAISGSE